MKNHRFKLAIFAAFLSCQSILDCAQVVAQPFATEALDKNLYRDGEIKRFNQSFQNWDMVCDEIIRQKRRFCSLSTFGTDASGRRVAHLTVSTSDEGKPAAMLRLPFGTVFEKNVEIHIIRHPEKNTQKPEIIKLVVPYCDAQGCLTVFGLKPSHIDALNKKSLFNIHFWIMDSSKHTKIMPDSKSHIPVTTNFSGNGFAEAIKGSMAISEISN